MLKIKKKRFACTAILRSERGFTFITLLLTITILFMSLPFAPFLIKSANYSSHHQEMSIQQFFYFLRDDVMKATDYAVTPTVVKLLNHDDETITIEQYGNLIRRQVKGTGHEIYLRDIQAVTFEKLPYGIHTTITSLQGETYEKTIIFYQ
ncbi:hypothetical protein KK120_01215 [Virgibacillus dakarensis]|uniref:competence type IV pilus minor pilin ComGF n=1 Tax=Virgibacillus dakarensis TaxID=1917889 RepID=UPI000B43664A|nr:ComGF family competence protein [Virgibacillus dakarensis]MBT2214449.1 hypothetical protein [Virgibacillus dakarensis]